MYKHITLCIPLNIVSKYRINIPSSFSSIMAQLESIQV